MNTKIEDQFLLAIRLHAQWQEVWLPIKAYPNYEASSRGRIRNIITNKELKQKAGFGGYPSVILSKNGHRNFCRVHRLICSAFKPNPANKPCVDHIDNNKLNNHIHNLRWVTHSQNIMNKSKHCNNSSGVTGVSWHIRLKKWVARITIDGITKNLGTFTSITKAKRARIAAVNKLFGIYANSETNR